MNNIREVFSANLKRFRLARGFSQAKLAEKIGSSYHYVGMLETTKKFPSSGMIEKLASALEIDPTELFMKEISPEITMKNSQKAAFLAVNQLISGYITGKVQKLDEDIGKNGD